MRKISMSFAKEALYNAFRFVINVGFIFLFQIMFHAENTLTAVALSVGFTMLPNSELHIRPGAMCCIVLLLYIGGGIAAQSALLHPALAFLINFWFLVMLLALISEPMEMKANISFLLCFVFSQSTYVPWTQFPARMACVSFGALLICGCIVLNWKRKGIGRNGYTLKEQFQRSRVHRSYILRMSLGISLAMLIASILQAVMDQHRRDVPDTAGIFRNTGKDTPPFHRYTGRDRAVLRFLPAADSSAVCNAGHHASGLYRLLSTGIQIQAGDQCHFSLECIPCHSGHQNSHRKPVVLPCIGHRDRDRDLHACRYSAQGAPYTALERAYRHGR